MEVGRASSSLPAWLAGWLLAPGVRGISTGLAGRPPLDSACALNAEMLSPSVSSEHKSTHCSIISNITLRIDFVTWRCVGLAHGERHTHTHGTQWQPTLQHTGSAAHM